MIYSVTKYYDTLILFTNPYFNRNGNSCYCCDEWILWNQLSFILNRLTLCTWFILVRGTYKHEFRKQLSAHDVHNIKVGAGLVLIHRAGYCRRKWSACNTKKKRQSCSCNRPWRPMGLWDAEAATFSRQLAHRWWWGCQPYEPAALYPPGRFLILISVSDCVDPRAIVRLEALGQFKNPMTSSRIEPYVV
jgi:hypothetical protein